MRVYKRVLNYSKYWKNTVSRSCQRGMTIVEYAVGAALVAAAVLVAFGALGNQISLFLSNMVVSIG